MLPALDPLSLILFVAALVATALATARRPSFGAAALAFITPFTFEHTVLGTTISFPKVMLLGVFVGLVPHRAKVLRTLGESRFVLLALGAMIVTTALTILVATFHPPAVRETFKWVEYFLFFALLYAAYRLEPNEPLLLGALAASITLVLASAVYEEFTAPSSVILFGNGTVPRLSGLLEGPNQLGGYLEVALPVAAVFAVRGMRSMVVLVFAVAFAVVLTFSKGAFVGCAVDLLAIAACYPHALRRLMPLYLGALAGVAADAAWIDIARHVPNPAGVASGTLAPRYDYAGGVGHRSELWRAAWFFFRHHPLLGIGAGNYELRLADAGVYGVRTHANNWYLQSLAEGGVVLFAATIALLTTIVRELVRVVRRSPWSVAALAATLALAVHQLADYLVFYPKVAEPWLILVALGLADPIARECD